jgi:hypothetical protein
MPVVEPFIPMVVSYKRAGGTGTRPFFILSLRGWGRVLHPPEFCLFPPVTAGVDYGSQRYISTRRLRARPLSVELSDF